MPSGGARPGSGKKAAIPQGEGVVVVVKPPGVYGIEQTAVNVPLDAKYIHGKMKKWLQAMGVYEKVDPFLIEEYALCAARVRQLEHVISLVGADDRNSNGDLYETPTHERYSEKLHFFKSGFFNNLSRSASL